MLRRPPKQEPPVETPMAPPFWVIGAPRSGTTFLARVLDHHPEIFLTNETRLMLLFSRMLNRWVGTRRLLATSRDEVIESLWQQVPRVVEQIYRDLGARPGQRWGDKYPQYADGDQDSEALATMDRLFPEGQYVHIIRDPRAVVASILSKGWLGFDEAIEAWRAFVTHAHSFGMIVGEDRYHEIHFESLVEDGHSTVQGIFTFLGLENHPEVDAFLRAEADKRTPVSAPMGRPGSIHREAWEGRLDESQVSKIEVELSGLLREFGYGAESGV